MILLVASNKDVASLSIKEQILRHYPFRKLAKTFQRNPIYAAEINGKTLNLVTLKDESVQAQDLPKKFPMAKLIVFISRHASQSGKPTLSVHVPGNFGEAELGGLPRKVSVSPAYPMQNALKALMFYKEKLNLNYEVSFECTHHGPSLAVPAMFVELGSSTAQWSDLKAADAVADSTIHSVTNFESNTSPIVLGIGGTHYNQRFTVMDLVGEFAFGHMIPKYATHLVDAEMISQCVEKTLGKVQLAVLDWKGIKSEDKQTVISALEAVGLPFKKV
jgi:D-aminoacyl-tRNA deacylase